MGLVLGLFGRMDLPAAPLLRSLSLDLAGIIGLRLRVVGVAGSRDRSAVPLFEILYRRVNRLRNRFTALVEKLLAGWRPVAARPQASRAGLDRPNGARLPGGYAWFFKLVPGEGAACGAQLQALMLRPEMQVLLAEVPVAGRMLRPLCEILGLAMGPPLGTESAAQPRTPAGNGRDVRGRFTRVVGRVKPYLKHWIEPYPGTDIRFLVE